MGEYIQSKLPKELVEMVARNLELEEMVREFGNNLSLFKDVKDVNLGLQFAILYRKKPLAKFFIDKGANDFLKPLEIASRNGYLHIVKDLMEWGAYDLVNYGMMAAAEGNHKDIIDYLITQGAYHWNMGMYGAARKCHTKLIKFFIEKGAKHFREGLREVALCGNLDVFKMFEGILKHRNSMLTEYYYQCLHNAARNNHKNIINYILKHHNIKFPLRFIAGGAAEGHQIELLRNVLQKMEEEKKDDDMTWGYILESAAKGGSIDLVNQMIEKVQHVNIDTWNTIMYIAIKGNHVELALYAISKGANEWNDGLRAACSVHNLDLIQFFIEKGADEWNEALVSSAGHGFLDLVRRFADKPNVDLNEAMNSAMDGKFYDIVYYLVSKGADDFEEAFFQAIADKSLTLIKYFVSKGVRKNWIREGIRQTKSHDIKEYLRSQL